MCFAPQRRDFSTSQLPKVVRTWCAFYILTSTCASRHNSVHFFNISTSGIVRAWGVLYMLTSKCASRHNGVQKVVQSWYILTWKCASCHNGVQCFIWPHGSAPTALASLLFDPPEPQIIGKTQWIATLLPFRAPASSFFWLVLFSDLLSSFLLFSDSSISAFPSVHIVESLTSKLPSITHSLYIPLSYPSLMMKNM